MVLDVLGIFLSAVNVLVGIVTIILAVIRRHKLYVVKINLLWLDVTVLSAVLLL